MKLAEECNRTHPPYQGPHPDDARRTDVGITWLWMVLKQIGLRLKKNHSEPPSRTAKESRLNAGSGKKKRSESTRRKSSLSMKAVLPRR